MFAASSVGVAVLDWGASRTSSQGRRRRDTICLPQATKEAGRNKSYLGLLGKEHDDKSTREPSCKEASEGLTRKGRED